jgi:cytochrome c oxidase subunit II
MNPEPQLYLPAARTETAGEIDMLFHAVNLMSVVLFILICGAAGYFVWKYRRQPGDEKTLSTPTFHSTAIEVFWSLGPLLVCIGLFHVATKQYMAGRVAPSDAIQVKVRARKWAWEFEYPSGRVSDELHAPVNKPVKLTMQTADVIHSFYVPNFRIKQDVVPGRYTTVWFQANQEGIDQIFCTEYCGLSHSDMLAKVHVESEEKYKEWVDFDPDKGKSPLEVGTRLYTEKACTTCHSLDGTTKPGGGPSFKGIYGKSETMADGSTATVDDAYIRESILVPTAKIVKGFQPIMPPFQGSLKDSQITGLIEFIKAQK